VVAVAAAASPAGRHGAPVGRAAPVAAAAPAAPPARRRGAARYSTRVLTFCSAAPVHIHVDILLDISLDISSDIQSAISSDISLDISSDLLPGNPGRFLHCHPSLHSGTGSCTVCGFGWAAIDPERKRGVCHGSVCLLPPRGWQSARWGVDGAENALVFLTRCHRMAPVTWELHGGPWGRWTAPLKWAAVARNHSFTLAPRGATSPQKC
jgi:hypothetical protein